MSDRPYIDPIQHAWRHCNPHAPLPSTLVRLAAPSRLVLSLYSSQCDGQLVAEMSAITQDTRAGLLIVATLPRISPTDESLREADPGCTEESVTGN